MRLLVLALVLTLHPDGSASGDYVGKMQDGEGKVLTILSHAATFGKEVWEKLRAPQGEEILQEVASRTTTLQNRNKALQRDLRDSKKGASPATFPIRERIASLTHEIDGILSRIEKFDQEIDSVMPHGNEWRGRIVDQAAAKPAALRDLERDWTGGRYDRALEDLDEGMAALARMQKAISCVQDSVAAKAPVCDEEANRLEKKSGS
jgi:hypothetical protein